LFAVPVNDLLAMKTSTTPHPAIASRADWLAARRQLLDQEKTLTRHHDRISAERRRLPMVRLDKDYVFEGPAVLGSNKLSDPTRAETEGGRMPQ
jgi:predicted dithiol-disulfide oxidoreductase (DUF899 family)